MISRLIYFVCGREHCDRMFVQKNMAAVRKAKNGILSLIPKEKGPRLYLRESLAVNINATVILSYLGVM